MGEAERPHNPRIGHKRFINTGPHFTAVAPHAENFDFELSEESPAHPGLGLYSLCPGPARGAHAPSAFATVNRVCVAPLAHVCVRRVLNSQTRRGPAWTAKGCGQEICRVFAENTDIHVLLCLFLSCPLRRQYLIRLLCPVLSLGPPRPV